MNYEPRAPKPWIIQQAEDAISGIVLIFIFIVGFIIYGIISLFTWADNGISQWQLRNVLSPSNIELVALYEDDDAAIQAMSLKYLPLRQTQKAVLTYSDWEDAEVYDLTSNTPAYPGLPVPQFMIVTLEEGEEGKGKEVRYVDFIYTVFKHPNVGEKLKNWLTLHGYEDADEFKLSNLSDPLGGGGHISRSVDNEPYSKTSIATQIMMRRIKMRSGHRIIYGTFQTPAKEGFYSDGFNEFLMKHAK